MIDHAGFLVDRKYSPSVRCNPHRVLGAGVVAALLVPATVSAALSNRPGQSELQSNTGTAINVLCPQMGAAGGGAGTLPPDQQALFEACRRLVQTANDNDGTGSSNFSLGLSDSDLNAALQQVSGEEGLTARSFTTETSSGQVANVGLRLTELRTGVSGVSLAHLQLKGNESSLLAYDRMAARDGRRGGGAAGDDSGLRVSKLGAFINGLVSTGDKDGTDKEDGFDFDTLGITAGVDYRFTGNFVMGVAGSYNRVKADYDKSATVAGGDVDLDGYGVTLYSTYYLDSFYLEGMAGYVSNDYDIKRRVLYTSNTAQPGENATAKANTDGDAVTLSGGAGYTFNHRALSYGPYTRVTYVDLDVDGYQEKGAGGLNIAVEDQSADSLTGVLGGQIAYAMSQSFGVLVPRASLEWIHEFSSDADVVKTRYVSDFTGTPLITRTDSLDSDYGSLSLGISAVSKGGLQGFLQYETWLGLEDISEHIFTAGGRWEF